VIVHHLSNSRSLRVLWLLEELGVDYELKRYQRDPQTRLAPPALRAVHPLGRSPIVVDGDLTLPESGAILECARARCGLTAASHPRLAAWLDRVHARPAYRRAVEKGGAPSGPPWFDVAA
jgi:glutathione S-transferase